jgi:hypothetical protein
MTLNNQNLEKFRTPVSQNCEYVESLMFGFDCRRLIIVGSFSGTEYIVQPKSRVFYQSISDSPFDSRHITIISALVSHDGKAWKLLFKQCSEKCN